MAFLHRLSLAGTARTQPLGTAAAGCLGQPALPSGFFSFLPLVRTRSGALGGAGLCRLPRLCFLRTVFDPRTVVRPLHHALHLGCHRPLVGPRPGRPVGRRTRTDRNGPQQRDLHHPRRILGSGRRPHAALEPRRSPCSAPASRTATAMDASRCLHRRRYRLVPLGFFLFRKFPPLGRFVRPFRGAGGLDQNRNRRPGPREGSLPTAALGQLLLARPFRPLRVAGLGRLGLGRALRLAGSARTAPSRHPGRRHPPRLLHRALQNPLVHHFHHLAFFPLLRSRRCRGRTDPGAPRRSRPAGRVADHDREAQLLPLRGRQRTLCLCADPARDGPIHPPSPRTGRGRSATRAHPWCGLSRELLSASLDLGGFPQHRLLRRKNSGPGARRHRLPCGRVGQSGRNPSAVGPRLPRSAFCPP